MADRFYGADLGAQKPSDLTESGSTTSKVVELRVNDTVYANVLQVILAVETILNHLKSREGSKIG